MPALIWPSKSLPELQPAEFIPEAIVYPQSRGYPDPSPGNSIYLGNNLEVMASLLSRYEQRIGLIYADPPFFTNKHYSARIGRGEDSRRPAEWQLSEGYADNWRNLDEYLDYLYPRLVLMHRLLSPTGTLYLHLDWHADAYARLLMDEIFGRDHLLNQIVWLYHGPSPIRRGFNRKHDTILAYVKSANYIFNIDSIREPYNPSTVRTFEASSKAGFGKMPDLKRGKVPEDWWYFPVIARLHKERTGYPTQKPEALIERIILASSRPEDIVADFFCGSGTTPLVAARNGRSFLASDIIWRAIHTTRSRLAELPSPAFSFWRNDATLIPSSKESINYRVEGNTISITDPVPLDYWEADPFWDGKMFHSVLQAKRPNRSDCIPLKLDLPTDWKRICVRAVTIEGFQIQQAQ